jgi:hypothetical protein
VINPLGDVWGDGFPGHAAKADQIMVAWARAADGSVQLARVGRSLVVEELSPVPGGAVGTPAVAACDEAWLVAWQGGGPAANSVLCSSVGASGTMPTEPLLVGDGSLVDALATGPAIHVLVLGPAGESLSLATIVFVAPTHPDPIPIIYRTAQVSLLPRGWEARGPDSAAPSHPEPIPIVGTTPSQPFPIPIIYGFEPACVDEEAGTATVRWHLRGGWTGEIVLDEQGVLDGPTFRRANGPPCRSGE